jgi:DNA-directed RNA polymerase specialized sigma24 family protein
MDSNSNKLSDLITGSQAGRESDFAQLYEIIYPLLSSYASRRVYNQQAASDIVSNSVVKIVRSIARFDDKLMLVFTAGCTKSPKTRSIRH